MKNKLIKTCFTGLALSVAGLAHANPQLSDYSAVSGAAMNIAAGSNVGGPLVSQAALTIGADVTLGTSTGARPSIYSGAAVTIGANATVGNVDAGAAVGIGAGVNAADVNAGAAVVLGASANVGSIVAGAAVTEGADSQSDSVAANTTPMAGTAESTSLDVGELLQEIETTVNYARDNNEAFILWMGTMAGMTFTSGDYRVNGVITVPASSYITFDCLGDIEAKISIHSVGAITLGAGANIILLNGCTSQNIQWTSEAAITLGAGVVFEGSAYALGAIDAVAADSVSGGLYSMAAVSVGHILKHVADSSAERDSVVDRPRSG
jgi:hypothetical protein